MPHVIGRGPLHQFWALRSAWIRANAPPKKKKSIEDIEV